MSERQAPFYCPYCGEEDLRPAEAGGWSCSSCLRVFELHYVGLAPAPGAARGAGS